MPKKADVVKAAQLLAAELSPQRDRIEELEITVKQLEVTAPSLQLSKRERHEPIINAAENKAATGQAGPAKTSIECGEVIVAANLLRRYAYTLIEKMAGKYNLAEYDTSGQKNQILIQVGTPDLATAVAQFTTNYRTPEV